MNEYSKKIERESLISKKRVLADLFKRYNIINSFDDLISQDLIKKICGIPTLFDIFTNLASEKAKGYDQIIGVSLYTLPWVHAIGAKAGIYSSALVSEKITRGYLVPEKDKKVILYTDIATTEHSLVEGAKYFISQGYKIEDALVLFENKNIKIKEKLKNNNLNLEIVISQEDLNSMFKIV